LEQIAVKIGVFEEAEEKIQELFGDQDDLPEDESEIVWDGSLTHEQKVAKLKVLRASKDVGRGMGIRLV
jgi:Mor family transcriptional regulator